MKQLQNGREIITSAKDDEFICVVTKKALKKVKVGEALDLIVESSDSNFLFTASQGE